MLHTSRKGRILYGVLGEECPDCPGVFEFISTDGVVKTQVICLTPDASRDGFGAFNKPAPGTPTVVVESDDGGQGFAIGHHALPKFDEETEEVPAFETPDENFTPGDKAMKTKGGARVLMKRGGLASIEGGAGAKVELNPTNNLVTITGSNEVATMDGYKATRGRRNVGTAEIACRHEEKWDSAVGVSFDRVRETRGTTDTDGVRRELAVESVTIAGKRETAICSFCEQLSSDGSWSSKGPSYSWGNGDQAMVLGNALVEALSTLIDIINRLQVNTAVGPSSPPLPVYQQELAQLKSQLSDTILSTFMSVSKDPAIP